MTDLNNIQRIYFLGIGGIGMSALARYFNLHGKVVSGYDKTPTALTAELEKEGIHITFEDTVETLDDKTDLVIFTPAIPKDHIQYNWYLQQKFTVLKRAEVLGITANQKFNISVAGSHGKTSTSSIIAHVLHSANRSIAAFLGGICINFNSNFIDGNDYAIAEADEFDRSFLHLHPSIALITSVDTDHLDIYGNLDAIKDSFRSFARNVKPDGILITNSSVPEEILNKDVRNYRYSLFDTEADFHIKNLHVSYGEYTFDVVHPHGVFVGMKSSYGGKHNIENAVGAIAIAVCLQINEDAIRQAIATFKGVKRRFETHLRTENVVYIDDYAHHPRELDAVISAARELYPDKKLTVVFQPHLFSRTKDLCDEFAASLSKADDLILLDIYPAREKPMEGVTSKIILDKVTLPDKIMTNKDALLNILAERKSEVVLTAGAGDIDTKVAEISALLSEQSKQ
jgi:UDP-N-acetylmuramate--alanine ligase